MTSTNIVETAGGHISISIEPAPNGTSVYMVRDRSNNDTQVGWATDIETARRIASDNVRCCFGKGAY